MAVSQYRFMISGVVAGVALFVMPMCAIAKVPQYTMMDADASEQDQALDKQFCEKMQKDLAENMRDPVETLALNSDLYFPKFPIPLENDPAEDVALIKKFLLNIHPEATGLKPVMTKFSFGKIEAYPPIVKDFDAAWDKIPAEQKDQLNFFDLDNYQAIVNPLLIKQYYKFTAGYLDFPAGRIMAIYVDLYDKRRKVSQYEIAPGMEAGLAGITQLKKLLPNIDPVIVQNHWYSFFLYPENVGKTLMLDPFFSPKIPKDYFFEEDHSYAVKMPEGYVHEMLLKDDRLSARPVCFFHLNNPGAWQ